ncbi:mannose-1-phosphate guanylyltransferase/mannose-1-phosphate guanylyltransferase/mannose-6-phosphate isomerase [Gillisia sp. Hel_I_86]|uniref:phosphomannose isomerase type II C-terminal cupin domain n=1 Tax=Gillisia sp. Hel_I_86 TaxID=1249981 RepID=UPI00119B7EE7|nr:phosphomannose isomerase type II C-terminal cupin domain [Gillisia sp. Hel_I_86]TVZ28684.1 mannose-1-phosphate guanylyltransferase/mannose-1-phosphate guanylyltransferase/mannose-6-phosphate isomerase [Gillisia sp. Hel_I_86]
MKTYKEERPWGNFERFTHNEVSTVKILTVNPNEELSLQFHHNREEFWRVLDGRGSFVIGDKTTIGRQGDEFFIPKETVHQIKTADSSVSILEIAFGNFDENDIVRLKDKYKRKDPK